MKYETGYGIVTITADNDDDIALLRELYDRLKGNCVSSYDDGDVDFNVFSVEDNPHLVAETVELDFYM